MINYRLVVWLSCNWLWERWSCAWYF